MKYNYLFNFAVSYLGGGLKRLYEYARWFNDNGGAYFIVHSRCEYFKKEFPNNKFFVSNQPKYQRIFSDCSYLDGVKNEIGIPDLYYSYGIPVYSPLGKLNWFHLSNVLPLKSRGVSLSLMDRLQLGYLGFKIKKNFRNADVISAESNYSLGLIDKTHADKLFLSINGSDDEINLFKAKNLIKKENLATVLGTHSYKRLKDSFSIFEMLKKKDKELKLMIIGNKDNIPKEILGNEDVIVLGLLPRNRVLENLIKTKYYISTTQIENSYNAASEGVFFADESYISDIEPHKELLTNIHFDKLNIPTSGRSVLHVKHEDLSLLNLKKWDQVVVEMIERVQVNVLR